MAGIIERIGSLAGTELAKAVNLAHSTFTARMGVHGHTGRAIVETIAEVCRNHPNLVGIGVGLLVEQLLAEEKRQHDAHVAAATAAAAAAGGADVATAASEGAEAALGGATPVHPQHHFELPHIPRPQFAHLRPGRVAWEVFGALVALKLASATARVFRRKRSGEVWFAPVAHIHLLSGTIATYYFVKALRSPKISAWRNAAVALFATDAIKPLLKYRPGPVPTLAAAPALAPIPAPQPTPAPAPAPTVAETIPDPLATSQPMQLS